MFYPYRQPIRMVMQRLLYAKKRQRVQTRSGTCVVDGAIIPGYGQILNRSYWKLPIVYAGFLGCTYAITLNSTRYETYRSAYRDISDTNGITNSYLDILPPGYTVSYPGGYSGLKSVITTKYNQYRRYRDLSIIASVAYYGLTLVEAYVDAQLFDF